MRLGRILGWMVIIVNLLLGWSKTEMLFVGKEFIIFRDSFNIYWNRYLMIFIFLYLSFVSDKCLNSF